MKSKHSINLSIEVVFYISKKINIIDIYVFALFFVFFFRPFKILSIFFGFILGE